MSALNFRWKNDHATVLFVHAHPDDETLANGGTISLLLQKGIPVAIVTATLGEEGEVLVPELTGLAADRSDQLGGYRIHEMLNAYEQLALNSSFKINSMFLGGAGHWRDSGMINSAANNNVKALVNGDIREQAKCLLDIIISLNPKIIITDDDKGSYGHPDHIRVNQITCYALYLLNKYTKISNEITMPKLYWNANPGYSDVDIKLMNDVGFQNDWNLPTYIIAEEQKQLRKDQLVTIDVNSVLDRKTAALDEYKTQLFLAEHGKIFVLPNKTALLVKSEEYYQPVSYELRDDFSECKFEIINPNSQYWNENRGLAELLNQHD